MAFIRNKKVPFRDDWEKFGKLFRRVVLRDRNDGVTHSREVLIEERLVFARVRSSEDKGPNYQTLINLSLINKIKITTFPARYVSGINKRRKMCYKSRTL